MAVSKCGGCGGTVFELKEHDHVRNANYKINFIQCMGCGVAIGVMPYYDAAILVRLLAEKMKIDLDR